ncbi:MAG: phage virion morphogenesis protein [Rhodospirillaceae bacterium]
MAGAAVTIDDARLRRLITQGPGRVVDAMDDIGMAMVGSSQRRFETNVGPGGKPWEPSKRAKKQGGQTLVDQGHLRDSLTYRVLGRVLQWGTNLVYAAIHQFGGTIKREARTQTIYRRLNARTGLLGTRFVKRGKSNFASDHAVGAYEIEMSARPYLGVDDVDEAEILDILAGHLRGAAA